MAEDTPQEADPLDAALPRVERMAHQLDGWLAAAAAAGAPEDPHALDVLGSLRGPLARALAAGRALGNAAPRSPADTEHGLAHKRAKRSARQ